MTKGACLTRIQQVESLWKEFEINHDSLLEDEDIDTNDDYFKKDVFSQVEETFLLRLGQFRDYLDTLANPVANDDQPAPPGTGGEVLSFGQAKLPNIELPTFAGDIKEWVKFRDKFEEMIVKRKNIANVYKMHYLNSALRGEALNLLDEIPVTGDNFENAWKTVKGYYNNNRLLVSELLSKLFSLKAMESESAQEITRVRTGTKNILQALKVLGSPVDQWDHIIVFLTVSRLVASTQRKWEEKVAKSENPQSPPAFTTLDEFLEVERLALQQLESAKHLAPFQDNQSREGHSNFFRNKAQNSKFVSKSVHVAQDNSGKSSSCALCAGNHFIMNCEQFKAKSPLDRKKIVMSKHLCFNCLSKHLVTNCHIAKRCQYCSGRHHSLLHYSGDSTGKSTSNHIQETQVISSSGMNEGNESSTNLCSVIPKLALSNNNDNAMVFLATAWIYVQARREGEMLARALVDQGAQSSFISEELCQRLKLKRHTVRVLISGVGGDTPFLCRSLVHFDIKPHFNSNYCCNVTAYVIPKITAYDPFDREAAASWTHLQGITLADPQFSQPGPVDVLLGAYIHAQIIEEGLRKGDPTSSPVATKTSLGWIVSGATTSKTTAERPHICVNLQTSDVELNTLLRSFWEIEELPTRGKILTDEEQQCERHYQQTVSRRDDGRYVVRLPIKSNFPASKNLGDSYTPAVRMLRNMERRFAKDPKLKEAYTEVIRDYLLTGHMRRRGPEDSEFNECYFLPHHGVIKESSTTTWLRTVFNASKKTDIDSSFNDFLHVGPNLLPEVTDLITKWRLYRFAFAADIEKMFRQIAMHVLDQHLQAVIWRETASEEMLIYFLTTVTFGFVCSPFLAIRTLKQLARDEESLHPLGGKVLEQEVYMDDVLSGARTLEEAKAKQTDVIQLLAKGGFKLRKWLANHEQLLDWLPTEMLASENILQMELDFSVLGITWCPAEDHFSFKLTLEPLSGPVTRRSVLSKIARLFDPLGWIAPVVIILKIFMQSLWALCKDWDSPLPSDRVEYWEKWYSSLSAITQIRVPRWLGVDQNQTYEIHGFADASKSAYAAVVYLRVISADVQITLLGAKTKVAPVKTLSIPRLELCGAHLLTKLVHHYLGILQFSTVQVHLWSDSKDVLYWLRDIPSKWPTFVANRCSEISTLLPDAYWHHINSTDNPADIASRGMSAEELAKNEELEKHRSKGEIQSEVTHISAENTESIWEIVQRYSTLRKLSRITVYILRFVRKCLVRVSFKTRVAEVIRDFPLPTDDIQITPLEDRQAKLVWCYLTQRVYFSVERKIFQEGKRLPRSHPWKNLNTELRRSLIRVGGRLRHALLDADEKSPVILPISSPFTQLVVRHFHHITLHGGAQLTLANVRSMFWIIKGKIVVKTLIRNCVTCQMYRNTKPYQLMGDLPRYRVEPTRPFLRSGVDYAGPFSLKTSRHRGYKSYKGYIAVFVCMSTKAVHLEVVSAYDTESFIAAFSRFVSRRGPCAKLFSDQGTNFVGADAELRKMFKKGSEFSHFVIQELNREGTLWRFNPPAAPHFGGIWEAAVKSVKFHLKRVIGEAILTFEEFSTLLCRIEACLNSRPLMPMSDDPTDLSVLTPANFLIGEPSFLFIEPRITEETVPPLKRWRRVRQMSQHLWDRWSHEYLHQLQRRVKWTTPQPSFRVGDLVLLRHEITPPSRWPLARVVETHEGKDGLVRVVTVRTATSVLQRPIVKLVPLMSTGDQD